MDDFMVQIDTDMIKECDHISYCMHECVLKWHNDLTRY